MSTLTELFNYFNKKNIDVFKSQKPGIVCIGGKYAKLIKDIDEIENRGFVVWESFYNNKWTSFIKNPPEILEYEDDDQEDEYMSSEEAKFWEMDAYEYDGDPDKFDEWREGSGY